MATKKERQRQLARQAYERRLERQARRARRTRQWWVGSVAAVLVVGVAVAATFLAGAFSPATSPKASASPSPKVTSAMVNGKCVYTKSGKAASKVSLPPAKPDTKAHYTATITTNRGTITMSLLNSKAPCTVNSFVSLADQGFFNNTPCPRLVTSGYYILQCGGGPGAGTGGPGYKFYSENLKGAKYTADTVAMANSGTADSNGSQFFLVYKDTNELGATYTPFGTITSGLSVLQAIAAKGDNNSNPAGGGNPNESVQIESVKISKT